MSAAKGLALTALQQNIPANVRLGWRVQLIAERTRSRCAGISHPAHPAQTPWPAQGLSGRQPHQDLGGGRDTSDTKSTTLDIPTKPT